VVNTNSGLLSPEGPLGDKQTLKKRFKKQLVVDTGNSSGKQVNSTLSPIKKKIIVKKKKVS
jgi:hypothetical protein